MGFSLDGRSAAVGVLAGAALVASVGAQEGRPEPGRFLDALSPGDRISIPEFEGPVRGADVGSRADGVNIRVLGGKHVREWSLTEDEIAELTELTALREAEGSERPTERQMSLASKAQHHPPEVVRVGEDFFVYRMWSGDEVFLPERQIKRISRPATQRAVEPGT